MTGPGDPGLPAVGSRVSVRYRLPGSDTQLTDVIGHLDEVAPMVLVRTASDGVVTVEPASIVSVRELSHRPIRNSEIRALEHAAALAWPGTEHQWLGGWLARAAGGHTSRANSAVPLDMSATLAELPAVAQWYRARDLPGWLALPERLLRVPADGVKANRVLVRDLVGDNAPGRTPAVTFTAAPDPSWLEVYQRAVPAEVLTAVVDGEITFGSVEGLAVGRAAVTAAPDGTRWLGISSVRVAERARRRGHARAVCEALLDWGAERGAQRCYVQVLADNTGALRLYESMGFTLHHRVRYVDIASVLGG